MGPYLFIIDMSLLHDRSFSNSASGTVVLNELYDSTSTTMGDNNYYNTIKTQITSEGEQTLYSTVD